MIPPKITQLPPAPVRADAPVDFSSKADAMVGALQPFADEANILAEFVNTRANNANTSASSVEGVESAVKADRVLSQQAASNAAGSAAASSASASTAKSRATAAQSFANASEASAVRAENAAEYVEGISGGAAPINNPNFQGVVKVNNVPLGTAATRDVGTADGNVLEVGAFGLGTIDSSSNPTDYDDAPHSGISLLSKGSGVPISDSPVGNGGGYVLTLSNIGSSFQLGVRNGGGNKISFRKKEYDSSTWHPFEEIYHTGNMPATATRWPTFAEVSGLTDAIANIPSVPKSAAYTVTAADKGKSIDTTTNVTIPASVFAVGDVIVVTNTSATNSTITPAAGVTFRLAGSASTGARTLAGYGVATFRMASSNVWFASGAGLT